MEILGLVLSCLQITLMIIAGACYLVRSYIKWKKNKNSSKQITQDQINQLFAMINEMKHKEVK